MRELLTIAALAGALGCAEPLALAENPSDPADPAAEPTPIAPTCAAEIVVLGAGQDAGAPQIGNWSDPAWRQDELRLTASAIALVEHDRSEATLFDAAPEISEHLHALHQMAELPETNLGLSRIFLTHAHIGHYAGLIYLGREAASTRGLPVHVMPRMDAFLRTNGPWSQLVSLGNITLEPLANHRSVPLGDGERRVTPLRVPHRDEFSETVGFLIETEARAALYLPDIDSWTEWAETYGLVLEQMIANVDVAFLDATFFDDDELPGRDMSEIPHPRVADTVSRLYRLPAEVRGRVQFIHYNHTNPIRFEDSDQSQAVLEAGFGIARAGDRHCLARLPTPNGT